MHSIAPTEKDTDNCAFEKCLCAAAPRSQIQNLCRTRDMLLPPLLSGQVEIAIEESPR
jgi:hypothetical protein